MAQEAQTLVIHVPDGWADGLPADVIAKIASSEQLHPSTPAHLPEGSKPLLAAIKYGLADMRKYVGKSLLTTPAQLCTPQG